MKFFKKKDKILQLSNAKKVKKTKELKDILVFAILGILLCSVGGMLVGEQIVIATNSPAVTEEDTLQQQEEVKEKIRLVSSNGATPTTAQPYYKSLLIKNGKNGVNGLDGLNGVNGSDGLNGLDGQLGKDGISGENGLDGQAGNNGVNGKKGVAGAAGKDGLNGKNGVNGVDGKNGNNGSDGKSAYTVAVEAGYVGTEAEYAKFMADTPNKIVTIEGGIDTLNTGVNDLNNALTGTNQRVEECFQDVSNGKTLVAAAITDKGIATAATDTFPIFSDNINKLADAQYNTGFIDGQKNVMDHLDVTYVKHSHTGSAAAGGGCYTGRATHTHASYPSSGTGCYTMCSAISSCIPGSCYGTSYHDFKCTVCSLVERTWDGSRGHPNAYYPHASAIPVCGYSQGQVLHNTLGCGYTEGQILTATITY